MYNFVQNYDVLYCKAYKCGQYCDLGSDRYCSLHMIEMFNLNNSSDDFNSKIKSDLLIAFYTQKHIQIYVVFFIYYLIYSCWWKLFLRSLKTTDVRVMSHRVGGDRTKWPQ